MITRTQLAANARPICVVTGLAAGIGLGYGGAGVGGAILGVVIGLTAAVLLTPVFRWVVENFELIQLVFVLAAAAAVLATWIVVFWGVR